MKNTTNARSKTTSFGGKFNNRSAKNKTTGRRLKERNQRRRRSSVDPNKSKTNRNKRDIFTESGILAKFIDYSRSRTKVNKYREGEGHVIELKTPYRSHSNYGNYITIYIHRNTKGSLSEEYIIEDDGHIVDIIEDNTFVVNDPDKRTIIRAIENAVDTYGFNIDHLEQAWHGSNCHEESRPLIKSYIYSSGNDLGSNMGRMIHIITQIESMRR